LNPWGIREFTVRRESEDYRVKALEREDAEAIVDNRVMEGILYKPVAEMREGRLNETRQRAGQLGGLTTSLRYGADYMRELGRRGGRNHGAYLSDDALRARAAKRKKEEALPDSTSRKELLRAWKSRSSSPVTA